MKAKKDNILSIKAAASAHGQLTPIAKEFETSWAFFFLGYKKEFYLWELVILARKGALALVGVAFTAYPDAQVMLGLFLMVIAAVAHARFLPFEDDLMNNYEFISLFTSFMTFFIGIFTLHVTDKTAASWVAFLINILYLCVALPIGYRMRNKQERLKDISQQIVNQRKKDALGKANHPLT